MNPRRITRSAIIIKPSSLLRFQTALKRRKYRLLFSTGGRNPGPKVSGEAGAVHIDLNAELLLHADQRSVANRISVASEGLLLYEHKSPTRICAILAEERYE